MILVDFNQVLISNIMSQIHSNPNAELNENLIRHMVLSSVLYYKRRFGENYGELVFCADSKKNWRKDVFKYYKANRKKMRDKSDFDWILIFDTLDKIKDELKTFFPYKLIEVEGAEADDIIAVICDRVSEDERVLILSSDKDFLQLHKNDNVFQYSPIQKKMLSTRDPKAYLYEHIIRGDSGDGVPNFLSGDDVFVDENKRQKPLRTKKVKEWLELIKECGPECIFENDDMSRNWYRNQTVIDLSQVPEKIENKILDEFEKSPNGERRFLLKYFIKNRLKNLMESIQEF